MSRENEIQLDGSEVTVIKAIGLSGGEVDGKTLLERLPDFVLAELVDTLHGLVAQAYVESDKGSYHRKEEFEKTHFHVNPSYAHDLKDALNPRPEPKKSRRVRRE
ncbi:MAG: hypothetical protein ABMA13_13165 [Chthoniobacteraceae bacterium]